MNMNIIRQQKSFLLTVLYTDKKTIKAIKIIKEKYFRHKRKNMTNSMDSFIVYTQIGEITYIFFIIFCLNDRISQIKINSINIPRNIIRL